jgi:type II secretory pathway predicted ATPase ExeA
MPRTKATVPFKVEANQPNPRPFPYADYVQAREGLKAALKGPCFYAQLDGASGMGKTELARDITDSLDRHRYNVVYLASANLSLVSIVRFLAGRLHVGARRSYIETADVVAETIYAQNAHMVIWIDEADQLGREALKEIRTLAEHKLCAKQILTVVFSGLPQLGHNLEAPVLFPLKRRIKHRYVLCGLRRDELDPFIEHRFGSQNASRIPNSVRDDLFERTQAAPAIIDQVVRHALGKTNGNIAPEVFNAVLDTHGL